MHIYLFIQFIKRYKQEIERKNKLVEEYITVCNGFVGQMSLFQSIPQGFSKS